MIIQIQKEKKKQPQQQTKATKYMIDDISEVRNRKNLISTITTTAR